MTKGLILTSPSGRRRRRAWGEGGPRGRGGGGAEGRGEINFCVEGIGAGVTRDLVRVFRCDALRSLLLRGISLPDSLFRCHFSRWLITGNCCVWLSWWLGSIAGVLSSFFPRGIYLLVHFLSLWFYSGVSFPGLVTGGFRVCVPWWRAGVAGFFIQVSYRNFFIWFLLLIAYIPPYL